MKNRFSRSRRSRFFIFILIFKPDGRWRERSMTMQNGVQMRFLKKEHAKNP